MKSNKTNYYKTNLWFAWYPVYCEGEDVYVWLEKVVRTRFRHRSPRYEIYDPERKPWQKKQSYWNFESF